MAHSLHYPPSLWQPQTDFRKSSSARGIGSGLTRNLVVFLLFCHRILVWCHCFIQLYIYPVVRQLSFAYSRLPILINSNLNHQSNNSTGSSNEKVNFFLLRSKILDICIYLSKCWIHYFFKCAKLIQKTDLVFRRTVRGEIIENCVPWREHWLGGLVNYNPPFWGSCPPTEDHLNEVKLLHAHQYTIDYK